MKKFYLWAIIVILVVLVFALIAPLLVFAIRVLAITMVIGLLIYFVVKLIRHYEKEDQQPNKNGDILND